MITIISNRKQILYSDLVTHLKKCSHPNIKRIILREKDMSLEGIKKKIKRIKSDPKLKTIPLLLNGPYDLMETFGADGRHYTMAQYKSLTSRPSFKIGVSVHSIDEIDWLNRCQIDYVLYGHIFPTACKAGLVERGCDNLKGLVELCQHPLVALGGIDLSNYEKLYERGCHEFAMMSTVMKHTCPNNLFEQFKENLL